MVKDQVDENVKNEQVKSLDDWTMSFRTLDFQCVC